VVLYENEGLEELVREPSGSDYEKHLASLGHDKMKTADWAGYSCL
jgi:hypothetical protein